MQTRQRQRQERLDRERLQYEAGYSVLVWQYDDDTDVKLRELAGLLA